MSKRRRRSRGLRGLLKPKADAHRDAFAFAAKKCGRLVGRARGRVHANCMRTQIARYHAGGA